LGRVDILFGYYHALFFGSKIMFSFFGQNLAGENIPFSHELFEKDGGLEVIIMSHVPGK